MNGKYILKDDLDMMGRGDLQILRETSKDVYETVIPDAGTNRGFALRLVDLMNSQGTETGKSTK